VTWTQGAIVPRDQVRMAAFAHHRSNYCREARVGLADSLRGMQYYY
jgi:hypothetical protein